MDYTKFPHQTGTPSREGERQARFLDTLGAPFLSHRNMDGSVSRKAGGRLYVDQAPSAALSTRYMSIGLVGGTRRIDGIKGDRLYGNFDPLGTLPGDGGLTGGLGGFEADIPRKLSHFSRSRAATQSLDAAGSSLQPGTDGLFYIVRTINIDKTSNGTTFERWATHQAWTATTSGVDGYNLMLPSCLPTVLSNGTQISAGYGYVGPTDGGAPDFTFLHSRGDALTTVRPVPSALPDTPGYKRGFIPFTTSPTGRVAFVYTESYPVTVGPSYSGLVATFSYDAGLTWSAQVYPEGLFGVGPRESGRWDGMASQIPKFVVPITPNLSLAGVTSYYPTGWLGGPTPLRRSRLVLIDSESRTFTPKATLGEGPLLGSEDYIGSATPIAGGVLFTLKTPIRANTGSGLLPLPYDLSVECWFTKTGDTVEFKGSMPWAAGQTGDIFAIDKNTVGCAVFADGEGYSVYASKNLGATWARIVSINIDGDLIVEDRFSHLNDFCTVVALSSNPTPGAPWITDARITPPTE